jgi:thymidylate synthase ThyX
MDPQVKSTRYIPWAKAVEYAIKDSHIMKSEFRDLYVNTITFLIDANQFAVEKLKDLLRTKNQDYLEARLQEAEAEGKDVATIRKSWEKSLGPAAFDIARLYLPPAIPTSGGYTCNAHTLRYTIDRMLSHPLAEVRELGKRLWDEGRKVVPYYLGDDSHIGKEVTEYYKNLESRVVEFVKDLPFNKNLEDKSAIEIQAPELVKVFDPKETYPSEIIDAAAMAFKHSHADFESIWNYFKQNPGLAKELVQVVEDLRPPKGKRASDLPTGWLPELPREFEHGGSMKELLMIYSGDRDVHRHKIWTRTRQLLTVDHGYVIPDEIKEAGLGEHFKNAMKVAADAYHKIAEKYPHEAQYLVPFAYMCRSLITSNVRNDKYFIELRSKEDGDSTKGSYREVTWEWTDKMKQYFPTIFGEGNIRSVRTRPPLGRMKSAIKYFEKLKKVIKGG